MRRGDYSGRLRHAIISGQLQLADILVGKLNRIDDFRCTFTDKGEGKRLQFFSLFQSTYYVRTLK